MPEGLRRTIGVLAGIVTASLDQLVLALEPSRTPERRALIVRLDAIGDFVLWLDAAKTLIDRYRQQGYSVVLIGNKAWAGWARSMGMADEVWDLDLPRFRRNLAYRWQWMRRVRRMAFTVAVQPTYSRVFIEGDSVIRASGAPERIGSTGNSANMPAWLKRWSDRWYTRLAPAALGPMMELKRNAQFMRALGFSDFQAKLPTIHPAAPAVPAHRLPATPYAVLFPAASWEGREWPLDSFAEIGRRLSTSGLHIVLAGGPADRERASRLATALPENTVNLAGATSLAELAEVLRGAAVVVTNETSAVHISAAVDAPVVCILGGGHFGRFAPYEIEKSGDRRALPEIVAVPMDCYGCNWLCQHPRNSGEPVKCIRDISVEDVWTATERALGKARSIR